MIWIIIIFYFIWIPICFISGWASVCAFSHEIYWKSITIGEFFTILITSIMPIANIIGSFIFCDELYRRDICFTFLDKPLFHERD